MTKKPPPTQTPPDRIQSQIRFACGFLIGLFLPFLLGFFWQATTIGWGFFAISIISALLCSFLSLRYGDRFWKMLLAFFR